jgi:nucleotidyltransferase substrate binding protein (TIGR01987 family)
MHSGLSMTSRQRLRNCAAPWRNLRNSTLIKAGCIQYFEFCFELGWKACKVVSAEQGLPDCLSPKACLRQAFTLGWIEDEAVWLEMLDARNRMAHTYDARKALQIYESLPQFHAALQKLLATLQSLVQK